MTITEILNIIHKERVELEIFQALSLWMVEDRSAWIDEAMEQKAIVRAINKIANGNPNKNEAIEGIKNLCDEYEWNSVLMEVNDMTPQEKWEEIYDVLDNMNIKYDTNYCSSETEALIEFWTDTAGQDIPTEFDYDGTPEDFVKQFTERAENYDVDEEVELYVNMRGKNGVPNTVRELLDDCQEAKDTLMEIAEKLQKAIE